MAFEPTGNPVGGTGAREPQQGAGRAGYTNTRLKPATTTGEGTPLGASLSTPMPAPLPARGTGVFFLLSLISAIVAVTFTIMIAFKL